MKIGALLSLLLCSILSAIPNSINGGIVSNNSPLNGIDITEPLIAAVSGGPLPGEWETEGSVPGTRSAYLLAHPEVFGQKALLVRGLWREEELEEIQITFNDAGSYFGYFSETIPGDLKGRARDELIKELFDEKQATFSELHAKSLALAKEQLALRAEKKRPKEIRFGKSRTIRAEVLQYSWDGLVARLFHGPERLVRITLSKEGLQTSQWMDREFSQLEGNEYKRLLQNRITKKENGDQVLSDLSIVPQGYKPYCGLNTLVMAGRYLGLHIDEDWLASAGKFQNTGSADGSQMLSLYSSVAREAGISMKRLSNFNEILVKRSLREGLPVIIWRRWSQERDRAHTEMSKNFARTGEGEWKPVDDSALPDKNSPLHASVIVGFNEARNEFLILESWAHIQGPRRMPMHELAKTSYLTFCFQH